MRAMAERSALVSPRLAIIAATRLGLPLRRNALYARCRDRVT